MANKIKIQVDGKQELDNLHKSISDINKELKQTKGLLTGAFGNQPEIDRLNKKIANLTQQKEKLSKQENTLASHIEKTTKAFEKQEKSFPRTSLKGLEKDYQELQERLASLNKEQLNSKGTQREIKQFKELGKEIDDTKRKLGLLQEKEKTGGGKRFSPLNVIRGVAVSALTLGAGYKAIQLGKEAVDTVVEYEQANADLNAVLAATSEETISLQSQQQKLGENTAFTASEVANLQLELGKLGFQMQEIIDATPGIINFAVATGVEVPRAAATAGAALRSFQLDAKEMDRVVSALGVATTKSSLDFSKLEAGLPIVGGVAQQFGATIEETTAQLGVLSDRGITAATAATALRNIYLKSAKAGLTFDQALDKLAHSQTVVNDALELYGVRGALQATILALNRDETDKLTESITDVNEELQIMAEKRLDTISGKTTLLTSAWQGLIVELDNGDGILGRMAKNTIKDITQEIKGFTAALQGLVPWYTIFYDAPIRNKLVEEAKARREFLEELSLEYANQTGVRSPNSALGQASLNLLGVRDAATPESTGPSKALSKNEQIIENLKKKLEELSNAEKKRNDKKKVYQEGSIAALRQELQLTKNLIDEETDSVKKFQLTEKVVELTEALKKAQQEVENTKQTIAKAAEDERYIRLGSAASLISSRGLPTSISSNTTAFQKEIEQDKKLLDEKLEEIKKFNEKRIELNYKRAKKEQEDELKIQKETQEELLVALTETAESINETLFKIEQNRADRRLRTELHLLDREYDARIDNAENTAASREQLEEEYQNRREELEREAFEKTKQRQIQEAIISGALAALQSLAKTALPFPASLIAPGVIAAKTAAEVAIISSSSYASGGFTSDEGVSDPKNPGRKIVGVVHNNEYVIREEEIKAFPDEVRRIEQHRVRSFADGGFTSPIDYDYISQQASPSSTISIEDVYDAVYNGTYKGSQSGTERGVQKGERDKQLRRIREYNANKNLTQ